ncbi:MAG: substrate-binding domain-containing protein [Bacteroidia bacterium]|nr:substrate-binding domain-containing protein [Bacteroidia bacterium]MDW8347218.1 substrate-binding domain-containing protein [Bacteroidia bacterium]
MRLQYIVSYLGFIFWMTGLATPILYAQNTTETPKFNSKSRGRMDPYRQAKKLDWQYYADYIEHGDYLVQSQVKEYENVLKMNPNSALANFKYGWAIMNSNSNTKSNALYYLLRAEEIDPKIDPRLKFYVGKIYQYMHDFNTALRYFEKYKEKLPKGGYEYKLTEQEIIACKHALEAIREENISHHKIINVAELNSPLADYVPILTPSGDRMYFTSCREMNFDTEESYMEDIYVSIKIDSIHWSTPIKLGEDRYLNSRWHESVISLSPDGKTIFLYNIGHGADLYQADLENAHHWTNVRPIPEIDGLTSREPSVCISPNGRIMMFSSNRAGSKGGLDLYYTVKDKKGKWTKPVNCEILNTIFDEDAPVIAHDGITIYFSSRGHNSMGGYDIFKSILDTVTMKFSVPVNLGYPLNSVGNDIYFVLNKDDKTGYFTSDREGGFGEKDIYYFELNTQKDKNLVQIENYEMEHQESSADVENEQQEIVIKGTDVMSPIIQEMVHKFMDYRKNCIIDSKVTGSLMGIRHLLNGVSDICVSTREMNASEIREMKMRYGEKAGYTIPIAHTYISIVVHKDNPIEEISFAQLRKIYTGEIKNWKELGGKDEIIQKFSLENFNDTYLHFKKLIMGTDFCDSTTVFVSSEEMPYKVAKYPNSIGFGLIEKGDNLKQLKVKKDDNEPATLPTAANVRSSLYPLTRDIYFILRENPKGIVKEFIDWVISAKGQDLARHSGCYPYY